MGSTQTVLKIDIMMGIFINKSNIYSLCCLYHPWQHSPPPSSHKSLLLLFKNLMHFFAVLLACKTLTAAHFASHKKCDSVHAFTHL